MPPTNTHGADFPERVEAWIPAEASRLSALVDDPQAHRATDDLLTSLGHPRWEFVIPPK